ncbi:MAG: FAD-binding oxidoreductase [Jatrophihabitans sp.]
MTELLLRPDVRFESEIDEELLCRAAVFITHDVTSFVLESPHGQRFAFQAGQYVTVTVTVDGQRLDRCYTISSPSTRTDQLEITVKRVPGGPVSNWLHDRLLPGDRVQVAGPLGRFTMSEYPARKYLFLSAGSGITPMMSMTRTLHQRGEADADIAFVHCARSPRDIVFRAELDHLATASTGVLVAAVCEADSPDEPWAGLRGRLTLDALLAVTPDLYDREVFTCGPAPYMAAVREILTVAGVDPVRCHEESFAFDHVTEEPPVLSASTAQTFSVEFRRSGRTIECDAATSLLQAGLRAGVILPSSCGEGVCGTCKTTKLAGQVDMQHGGGIRPREIAQDKILLCCSTPLADLVLDA